MSEKGNPKKSVRASEEFWQEFDEYWRDEGYSNRSEAVRDILADEMEDYPDLMEVADFRWQTYLDALESGNDDLAERTIDALYEVSDVMGQAADDLYKEVLEEEE